MTEEIQPPIVPTIAELLSEKLQHWQDLSERIVLTEPEPKPIDTQAALLKEGFPPRHATHSKPLTGPAAGVVDELWPTVQGGDCIIVLCGARGTGKTQIGTELARRRILAGKSAGKYAKCYDILAEIKATWHDGGRKIGTEQDVLKKYRTTKYLVIDEWNERGASAWESVTLTNILDHRYDLRLATVIVCNSPADKLHDHIDSSILDRAAETGGIKSCEWASYRQAQ